MAKSGDNQKFIQDCLEEHNKLRAQHGNPPLKLNAKLTNLAKNWAQSLAKRNAMEHRPKNDYGENIYFADGMRVEGGHPVRMWYSEIDKYDFAKSLFSAETGHFTQLVWRDTKEVGIAVVYAGTKMYVVANYNPPGNVQGQFKENVPPKK